MIGPRSQIPPPLVTSVRILGVGALVAMLVLGAMLAYPPQPFDICLSQDGLRDLCYCERISQGLVRQPVGVLSSAGFAIAGLGMLVKHGPAQPETRGSIRVRGIFATDVRLRLVFCFCSLMLGAASISFHATFKLLPGLFDSVAILFWTNFMTALNVGRLRSWSGDQVLRAFAIATAVQFAVVLASLPLAPHVHGPHLVTLASGACAALSPLFVYRYRGFPGWPSERWILASLLVFVTGFVVVHRAGTGSPWCREDSWLQGHGLWHVTCALAIWLSYEHARRTFP